MFDFFQELQKDRQASASKEAPQQRILTEVVSAMGLSRDARDGVDPFVIIKKGSKEGNKEVHRTKPVSNDGNPIWTIKTKSLCVLTIPEKNNEVGVSNTENTTPANDFFLFEVCDGFRSLATLTLSSDEIAKNLTAERLEYRMQPQKGSKLMRPLLVLRFRNATPEECLFLGVHPKCTEDKNNGNNKKEKIQDQTVNGRANDMDFKEVRIKNIFQQDKKRKDGVEYLRVMPGPDPSRPAKETEWMTQEQIYKEALKPSKKWVNAGHGHIGKIYLEILACDNLPRMDINPNDDTDPFVGIVFEDNLLRTDMIWDEPNPRWMPWTMRAFCLNVRHPTSLLMIGVFDYDETIIDDHDPIGRVVINTAKFYSDTEYLLRYNLHHDPRQQDESSRGSILIRLRLEWLSEVDAMKASYAAPPKFIINCPSVKSHQVLRYLTRGAVDMEKPTVDSVKLYAAEVTSYWTHYCYFLDVLFEILLWRGRWYISSKTSVWFPIQSMVFAAFILVSIERPELCASMFFYMLAWCLLSTNFYASRHPNPWKRVKRSEETNLVVLTGRSFHPAITIEPDKGVEEAKIVDLVDQLRGERMSKLITEFLYFMLKVYRIYSKTTVTANFFSTPNNQWSFLSGRLYYLHMLLKYICQYARLYLALINWQGYYTNKVTTMFLAMGTLYLVPHVHHLTWWIVRIVAWTLLGPWMKLLDVYLVHRWFKTSDELMKIVQSCGTPDPDLPDFEQLLESEVFLNMSKSGRVIGENAIKLKDMREHIFGQYSEVVPVVDSSRYPSVPLPSSSARPWLVDYEPLVTKQESHVPGQELSGSMVLKVAASEEEMPLLVRDTTWRSTSNMKYWFVAIVIVFFSFYIPVSVADESVDTNQVSGPQITPTTWVVTATTHMPKPLAHMFAKDLSKQANYLHWTCYRQEPTLPTDKLQCCREIYQVQESDPFHLCWKKKACTPDQVGRSEFMHFCTEQIVPIDLETSGQSVEPRFSLLVAPLLAELPSDQWRQYISFDSTKGGQWVYEIQSPFRLAMDPASFFAGPHASEAETHFAATLSSMILADIDQEEDFRDLKLEISVSLPDANPPDALYTVSLTVLLYLPEAAGLRQTKTPVSCRASAGSCQVLMKPENSKKMGQQSLVHMLVSLTNIPSTGASVEWKNSIALDEDNVILPAPFLFAGKASSAEGSIVLDWIPTAMENIALATSLEEDNEL